MKKIFAFALLLLTAMNASGEVYLEYSEEMSGILIDNPNAAELIHKLIGQDQLFLYAGSSLGGQQVKLEISADNPLRSCYEVNRLDDLCSENDLLERTPSVDVSHWFKFLGELVSRERQNERGTVILTGIEGHLTYVVRTLREQGVPFYLFAYEGTSPSPLIYVSIGTTRNVPQMDKLIGISPFESNLQPLPACTFECTRRQEYALLEKCLQHRVDGVLTGFQWRYPSRPLNPEFLECPVNTFPPFPQVEKGMLNVLRFPYRKSDFFSAMKSCWSHHGLLVDASEWPYADIKIEATVRVASANVDTVQALPKKIYSELFSVLGDEEKPYPVTAERRLILRFKGCD